MKDNLIYSQTTRVVGEKNNVDNFKLGIKRLEDSKFNYANLNFFEIQELLDKDNYKEIFNNYYGMFLMDNSAFTEIFNKYDQADLVDKLQKNIAIVEYL